MRLGAVGEEHRDGDAADRVLRHQVCLDVLGVDHAIVELLEQAVADRGVAQAVGDGDQVPLDVLGLHLGAELGQVHPGGLDHLDARLLLEWLEESLGLALLVPAAKADEHQLVRRPLRGGDDVGEGHAEGRAVNLVCGDASTGAECDQGTGRVPHLDGEW